ILDRLDRGAWIDADLEAAALNRRAAALGERYAIGLGFTGTSPGFFSWQPGPFTRPFDVRTQPPSG
ncbi:MAG: hypothetical protein ABI838_05405, partial [Chloroflexota bacterium]